uniref:Tail protein n=1 Tax=viral metagenome TaxID=1070528 RepID=A0A6M3M100_9ZZZZ
MKVKLDNLNRLILNVKASDEQLKSIGDDIIIPDLLSNWNKGRGGDGSVMESLSPGYAAKKKKAGLKPIPDMKYDGVLRDGMITKKKSEGVYVVTADTNAHKPKSTNIKILEYNIDRRPQLLTLSQKMRKDVLTFINKVILKGVQTA